MATLKIKKGDTVKVIAGKDNGKEGKVLSVDPQGYCRRRWNCYKAHKAFSS